MNAIAPKPPKDAAIGDNSAAAPLAELLAEETEALEKRALELAGAASRAVVTDEETAGKATLLAKMIREHRNDIEAARETRKEPFLKDGRTVDAHFGAIDKLLADVDGKKKVIGGPLARVIGLISTYQDEQEAKAAAESLRLQQEVQRLRDEAHAAEQARLASAASAHPEEQIDLEIKALQSNQQAEALAQQANSIATAAPRIDSGFGAKAGRRKEYSAVITDLSAALKHCRKVDEASILAAVQQVYDRQVRAGVRTLPGAEVKESTTTVIR